MQINVFNKETQSFETKEFEKHDLDLLVQYFVDGITNIRNNHFKLNHFSTNFTFEIESLRKYIRINVCDPHRSVYCFIDKVTGDIFKPAGWKAPAKHARGNIFNFDNGLKNMGPYGPAYLR